jgi:hypothetical protein
MSDTHDQRLRACVAQEAARILLDEGVEDYHLAKRKAAARLNASNRRLLPRNSEIERAVLDHQRIFFTKGYDDLVSMLRHTALKIMSLLREFQPRLTGSVLKGTASPHSDINIHLFADSVEDVLFALMDAGIVYRSVERRLRFGDDARYYPALRFLTDGHWVESVVLPIDALKQPPVSPTDAKSMQRATIQQVERLLSSDGA